MDDSEVRLLVAQLRHTLDLLNGQFKSLEARLSHQAELSEMRLSSLERSQADQEARLRAVAELGCAPDHLHQPGPGSPGRLRADPLRDRGLAGAMIQTQV